MTAPLLSGGELSVAAEGGIGTVAAMFRRLCTFILMIACAIAPAITVHADASKSDACCCEKSCACDTKDCATVPNAPIRTANVPATVVEQRVTATQPAARGVAFVFAQLFTATSRDVATDSHQPFVWQMA